MKATMKKIKEARQTYIYGSTTGLYIPVSKSKFIAAMQDLGDDLIDDWGNSRLRFFADGDVQLEI